MDQARPRALAGILLLAALVPTTPAPAASQGSLGASSRGSLMIGITIRASNRASGLADFALDGADATAARAVCLSGDVHTYTVAASGSGPAGALTLSNGAESIGYRVEWQAVGPTSLPGDAPVVLRSVADPATCTGAPGARRLRIALEAAAAERLQRGAYAGVLLLMLAPE